MTGPALATALTKCLQLRFVSNSVMKDVCAAAKLDVNAVGSDLKWIKESWKGVSTWRGLQQAQLHVARHSMLA